jgi:hypothetical protein
MGPSRRAAFALILSACLAFFIISHPPHTTEVWRHALVQSSSTTTLADSSTTFEDASAGGHSSDNLRELEDSRPHFKPGTAKQAGFSYTRTLVMARMSDENVDWIAEETPDLQTAIYVADAPSASLHPPKNKGHEVMIFLTYIISHYNNLPDVVIFMHAHRWSWHNNVLSGFDAVQMIQNLSNGRVTREGYMNLRCHWDPGCPEWIHPLDAEDDISKQEQKTLGQAWYELFPGDPMPEVLAQPCCAQFAISKGRILSIPLERFISYRDWLLRTPLSDYISGRVWEYIWQFVFTGNNTSCPKMNICYCDGYGFCFGGEKQFSEWFEIYDRRQESEEELSRWREAKEAVDKAQENGDQEELAKLEFPESGKDEYLEEQIIALNKELESRKLTAIQRGRDPKIRAEEAGRPWFDGDGF